METALMALGRNPWFNQKGSGGVMTKHILSRKSMEKPAPPRAARANGHTADREARTAETAFLVYRDMGLGRSLAALERELKQHHPELAVAGQTLLKWSVAHQWGERGHAARQRKVCPGHIRRRAQLDGEFDQVDKLRRAAHLAIVKALTATGTVVNKPSHVKTRSTPQRTRSRWLSRSRSRGMVRHVSRSSGRLRGCST